MLLLDSTDSALSHILPNYIFETAFFYVENHVEKAKKNMQNRNINFLTTLDSQEKLLIFSKF
jgi:hypothetical protein